MSNIRIEPDAYLRILEQLARFGVGTPGQLYRAAGCHLSEFKNVMQYLVKEKWIARIENYKIREGMRKDYLTEVFYLNQKGADKIKFFMGGTEAFFIRVGEPCEVGFNRIFHDLLVGEAFLYFDKKYKITEFRNENHIRHSKFVDEKLRTRYSGDIDYEAIKTMGDFRLTIETEDKQIVEKEIEVIIRYSREQLERKPKHVEYVTCSQQQADLIKTVTGKTAVILDDVLEPISAAQFLLSNPSCQL